MLQKNFTVGAFVLLLSLTTAAKADEFSCNFRNVTIEEGCAGDAKCIDDTTFTGSFTGSLQITATESAEKPYIAKLHAVSTNDGETVVDDTTTNDVVKLASEYKQESDELLRVLFYALKIKTTDIASFVTYQLSPDADTGMSGLLVFLNARGKVLGRGGMIGWMPVVCQ